MTSCKDIQKKLELPKISQIGVVVKNLERTAEYFNTIFDFGPFIIYEFAPDKHWYKEEPSSLRLLMGKATWGEIELELIQPLEGRSIHREFLNIHGEGLQHIGFNVRNYDEVCQSLISQDFEPLMRAETYVETYRGYLKACYFDTRMLGGVVCEIIWKSWLPECQPK